MKHYLFLILCLLLNLLNTVLGCWWLGSKKVTTTPRPTTTKRPKPQKHYHILFDYKSGDVPGCTKCRFIKLYFSNLMEKDHLFFELGKYDVDEKYMDKISTMSIKGNYLSTFKFNTGQDRGFADEEITFMYNKGAVFGTITYTYGYGFVQFTIRQLQPGVTIIEELFKSDFLPLPSRIKRSNFRFYNLAR